MGYKSGDVELMSHNTYKLYEAIYTFQYMIDIMVASFSNPPASSLNQMATESAQITIPLVQKAKILAEEILLSYSELSEEAEALRTQADNDRARIATLESNYADLLVRVNALEANSHIHEGA